MAQRYPGFVDELGYIPFDCDNHYYEQRRPSPAMSSPAMPPRCVQWAG